MHLLLALVCSLLGAALHQEENPEDLLKKLPPEKLRELLKLIQEQK